MFGIFKAVYHGLIAGWSGTDKYNHLYGIPSNKPDTPDTPDTALLDEIALLEIIIERRKRAASTLEYQLDSISDSNKRITIITKLNTMDKQTFKDVQRLNKLKDMI